MRTALGILYIAIAITDLILALSVVQRALDTGQAFVFYSLIASAVLLVVAGINILRRSRVRK